MNDRELLEFIAAQVGGLTQEVVGIKKLTQEIVGIKKGLGNLEIKVDAIDRTVIHMENVILKAL